MKHIKRGHTVEFIKPFIETLSNRIALVIEQETRGFVREIFDNKLYIKIPDYNISIILIQDEIYKYLKVLR